jgi:hypothetical protein
MDWFGGPLSGLVVLALIVFLVWKTERIRPDRQHGRAEDEAKARSYGDDSMNVP